MMQAMVDNVTGMVYWLPVDQSAAAATPMPPFAPVVMQPASYRLLRPVMTPQVSVPAPVETNTTVFVRGIPREATTQTIESHFNVHGEVVSCHVIRHKDASTNKGIAFVKFRDAQAAQRAINANHPGVMDAREVFAEWAHPRPASSASHALPDHLAGSRSGTSRVYLTSPAPRHVITGPGFIPFASPQPWIPIGGTPSTVLAPYGSSSYLSPGVGGHVLGFPAAGGHAGFSGRESYAPHKRFSTSGNYYFPLTDYNSAYSSAAPAVISTRSGSSLNQSRYENDSIPLLDPEAKSELDVHEADSLTLDQLHLSDPERISSTKSRKGKEEEL